MLGRSESDPRSGIYCVVPSVVIRYFGKSDIGFSGSSSDSGGGIGAGHESVAVVLAFVFVEFGTGYT